MYHSTLNTFLDLSPHCWVDETTIRFYIITSTTARENFELFHCWNNSNAPEYLYKFHQYPLRRCNAFRAKYCAPKKHTSGYTYHLADCGCQLKQTQGRCHPHPHFGARPVEQIRTQHFVRFLIMIKVIIFERKRIHFFIIFLFFSIVFKQ